MPLPYDQAVTCDLCKEGRPCANTSCTTTTKRQRLEWLSKFDYNGLSLEIKRMILKEVLMDKDGMLGFSVSWSRTNLEIKKNVLWRSVTLVCADWHQFEQSIISKIRFFTSNDPPSVLLPISKFKNLTKDNRTLIRHVDLNVEALNKTRLTQLKRCTHLKSLNIVAQESWFQHFSAPNFMDARTPEVVAALKLPKHGFTALDVIKLGTKNITYSWRFSSWHNRHHLDCVWEVFFENTGDVGARPKRWIAVLEDDQEMHGRRQA